MTNPEDVVKEPEPTGGEQTPPEQTPPEGSEPVKTPEEPEKSPSEKAEELLGKDGKRVVDATRLNELIDKAKLADTFGPVIDKIKDKPELVEELLETKEKGSIEERVARMEEQRKEDEKNVMKTALTDALSKFKNFEKDWPDLKEQVSALMKRGVGAEDAMRRAYIALHPEEAAAEATRIAQEGMNQAGQQKPSGGAAPTVIDNTPSESLSPEENRVAEDLIGKSINGWTPFKTKEDYAASLKRNEARLRENGFYD